MNLFTNELNTNMNQYFSYLNYSSSLSVTISSLYRRSIDKLFIKQFNSSISGYLFEYPALYKYSYTNSIQEINKDYETLINNLEYIYKESFNKNIKDFILNEYQSTNSQHILVYNYGNHTHINLDSHGSIDDVYPEYTTLEMEDYVLFSNNYKLLNKAAYDIYEGISDNTDIFNKIYNVSYTLINYNLFKNKEYMQQKVTQYEYISLVFYFMVFFHLIIFIILIAIQTKYIKYQTKIASIFNSLKNWEINLLIEKLDTRIDILIQKKITNPIEEEIDLNFDLVHHSAMGKIIPSHLKKSSSKSHNYNNLIKASKNIEISNYANKIKNSGHVKAFESNTSSNFPNKSNKSIQANTQGGNNDNALNPTPDANLPGTPQSESQSLTPSDINFDENTSNIQVNPKSLTSFILSMMLVFLLLIGFTLILFLCSHKILQIQQNRIDFQTSLTDFYSQNPYLYTTFYRFVKTPIKLDNLNLINNKFNYTFNDYNNTYPYEELEQQIDTSRKKISLLKDSFELSNIYEKDSLKTDSVLTTVLQTSLCNSFLATHLNNVTGICDNIQEVAKQDMDYYKFGLYYYFNKLNNNFQILLNFIADSYTAEINNVILSNYSHYSANYEALLYNLTLYCNDQYLSLINIYVYVIIVISATNILVLIYILVLWKNFINRIMNHESVSKQLIFDLPISLIEFNQDTYRLILS